MTIPFDYDFPVSSSISPASYDEMSPIASALAAADSVYPAVKVHTRQNYASLSPERATRVALKGRARGPSTSTASSSTSNSSAPSASSSPSPYASRRTASLLTAPPTSVSRYANQPYWERPPRGQSLSVHLDENAFDSDDEDEEDTYARYSADDQHYYSTVYGHTPYGRKPLPRTSRPVSRRSQSPFADTDPLQPRRYSATYSLPVHTVTSTAPGLNNSPRSLATSLPISRSYEEESPLRTASAALADALTREKKEKRQSLSLDCDFNEKYESPSSCGGTGSRRPNPNRLSLELRRRNWEEYSEERENTHTEKRGDQPTVARQTSFSEERNEEDEVAEDLEAIDHYTPSCSEGLKRRWRIFSLSLRFGIFRAKRRFRRRVGL